MQPKTIIILILFFVLVVSASQPLGQIMVDIGNIFTQIGHNLQSFNISGHG